MSVTNESFFYVKLASGVHNFNTGIDDEFISYNINMCIYFTICRGYTTFLILFKFLLAFSN